MEKEKPPDDFFKGIKISLKSVLKHPDINTPRITNAVIKCNKIVIQIGEKHFSPIGNLFFKIWIW
jgi:hypothetical protein